MAEVGELAKRARRTTSWQAAAYAVFAILLWAFPILRVLHAESAAAVASFAYFCAGAGSVALFRRGQETRRVLLSQEGLLAVPWLLLTVTLAWAPNRGYPLGLVLFMLFAPVSVAFSVSVARFVTSIRAKRPVAVLIGIGLLTVVGGLVVDIGMRPQFFTYNPVFGGVLGPVYEDELTITRGLFVSRIVALAWAVIFVRLAARMRGSAPRRSFEYVAILAAAMIVTASVFYEPLRTGNSHQWLQRSLGNSLQTEHFDIWFDGEMDPAERQVMEWLHEFRYEQLAGRTGIDVPERILSYVYSDESTKGALTGARNTNVAPVWLSDPQSHVTRGSFEVSFPHELAHVFSRSFGLPLLNASLSVGLVEGWAEALEPPIGLPNVHDQVAASLLVSDSLGITTPRDLALGLSTQLRSAGFWTVRSAVSYTTMGSFVSYLLESYGTAPFVRVYRGSDWADAYGVDVDSLTTGWLSFVGERSLRKEVVDLVASRFSRPSRFERPSPHYVPRHIRVHRRAMHALAEGDTLRAKRLLLEGLSLAPADPGLLGSLASVELARGRPRRVTRLLFARLSHTADPLIWVRYGDAMTLLGHAEAARNSYRKASEMAGPFGRGIRARLDLRGRLAGRPASVLARYRGRLAELEAGPLDEDTSAALDLERAIALNENGRYGEAVRRWPLCSTLGNPESTAACEVWLGEAGLKAGRIAVSRAAYEDAQRTYARLGDESAVDFARDRASFVEWVENRHRDPDKAASSDSRRQ